MGRRTILLLVAAVVALLGTALVFLYVKGVDNRAREGQETVQVLYTKTSIGLGTTANAAQSGGGFESRDIPRDAAAAGSLSSVDGIKDLVALQAIPAGQPVVSSQWGTPGTTSSLPVPAGKLGVSTQLADPNRVAGFVVPGSQVAVFATVADSSGKDITTVLLPKVTVLAVGPTTAAPAQSAAATGQTNTEAVPNAILTLALDQKQASQLIFAQSKGELYLGLLTKDSKVSAGGSQINDGNLFS